MFDNLEKQLQRVQEVFDSVTKRDYFEFDFRENAAGRLNECEEELGAFSHEVYAGKKCEK
jgi:hypothetical protein